MHCQMDLVTVEVVVEGTIGLYGDLPRYFSHLQKLPQHGSTTSHGEADQVTFTQDLHSINILQALQIKPSNQILDAMNQFCWFIFKSKYLMRY